MYEQGGTYRKGEAKKRNIFLRCKACDDICLSCWNALNNFFLIFLLFWQAQLPWAFKETTFSVGAAEYNRPHRKFSQISRFLVTYFMRRSRRITLHPTHWAKFYEADRNPCVALLVCISWGLTGTLATLVYHRPPPYRAPATLIKYNLRSNPWRIAGRVSNARLVESKKYTSKSLSAILQ